MHVADLLRNDHTMTEIENEINSHCWRVEEHVEEDTYRPYSHSLTPPRQKNANGTSLPRSAWEPGNNIAASCRKEWWSEDNFVHI